MPKSRAWPAPTSPRSPEVLIEDLKLQAQLDGWDWGKDIQREFIRLWAEARGIDPESFNDAGFSARDRMTRAPRLLGLTHKPDRGKEGKFVFTPAGRALLDAPDPRLVFQRQWAKVQYGSPLHKSGGFEDMCIRPLTAMIWLMKRLGRLTMDEIAVFVITTLDYRDLEATAKRIEDYRVQLHATAPGRARAEFREERLLDEVQHVYIDDIEQGDLSLREGDRSSNKDLRKFVKTKRGNLRDYADATMRYMAATGIFVRDIRSQAITFSVEGEADGLFLLETVGLKPYALDAFSYDEYVLGYLGLDDSPAIRRDDPDEQAADLASLTEKLAPVDAPAASALQAEFRQADANERLNVLRQAELTLSERMEYEEALQLLHDRGMAAAEIRARYEVIADRRSDQVARPLAYEWNTWRALVVINDALSVRGNFSRDIDGRPRTTAAGGCADILVEFKDFWLLVEVTLASGARQYETEGEPIMRHLGRVQAERKAAGDDRPVFALFIAETLNHAVIPFMRTQAIMGDVKMYGGPVRIVPMQRSYFVDMMDRIIVDESYASERLLEFLETVTDREFILGTSEEDWIDRVHAGVT